VLKEAHVGNAQVHAWMYATYRREYENFTHLPGETIDALFFKSRSALLGACTSCPVLYKEIDEMHAYTVYLEAKLKEPIPTSCSTCELHALKNLELAHYVDRLQDENGELRKLMGWLFGYEPQLRIMIETFKRQNGEGLGSNKVGEGSRENILEPPKTHHKNDFPFVSLK
jgi:hypothetical protein